MNDTVALSLLLVGGVPISIALAVGMYSWIKLVLDGDEDAQFVGLIAVSIVCVVCLITGVGHFWGWWK